jgi:SRP54-type protein, GTPase domain
MRNSGSLTALLAARAKVRWTLCVSRMCACVQAVEAAVKQDLDLVVCDTSGRLHTNARLMEELAKCRRSLGKRLPGAPHQSLLVLDGTTGGLGCGCTAWQAALHGDRSVPHDAAWCAPPSVKWSLCAVLQLQLRGSPP